MNKKRGKKMGEQFEEADDEFIDSLNSLDLDDIEE
jgi:hypothetical protein